jgi:hypothetical protein
MVFLAGFLGQLMSVMFISVFGAPVALAVLVIATATETRPVIRGRTPN